MINGLIIDTSGHEGIVVWVCDGVPSQTFALPEGRALLKNLFVTLPSLNKIKFNYIAVGQGPGTFTGTRVGAMTAQALAFGWEIPLIPFSSTLLPNIEEIAQLTYAAFLRGETSQQIELVYISPTA